jgi:hypothetical protein
MRVDDLAGQLGIAFVGGRHAFRETLDAIRTMQGTTSASRRSSAGTDSGAVSSISVNMAPGGSWPVRAKCSHASLVKNVPAAIG